jgi:hypothetical protein
MFVGFPQAAGGQVGHCTRHSRPVRPRGSGRNLLLNRSRRAFFNRPLQPAFIVRYSPDFKGATWPMTLYDPTPGSRPIPEPIHRPMANF